MDLAASAGAGLITVSLLYFAAARLLASKAMGACAAALFVATPVLWAAWRNDPASLRPLLAVTGWLLAMTHVTPGAAVAWPLLAGAALGAGMYSTPAALVMMPLCALATLVLFAVERQLTIRDAAAFSAAALLTAAPSAVTLFGPQDEFRRIIEATHLYDANRFNILQGIREVTSWVGLTARSETSSYDYFSPAFLFFTGGVLLPPLLLLLPIGLYHILEKGGAAARLVLAGLLLAPAAAALTAEAPMPGRVLFMTPFAALISAYGLQKIVSWLKTARP